jgi:4-amino-4-deoxy-L-arabinose transferase-like glycosyltransferase
MGMGENLVAANGKRSFFLFMLARWACIPFSWIGAIVCYLWARDLYGRPSGVMAAAIWCFEPNILAHASLITSDAAGTALGLAACYTFWRWLRQPTWSQAALTGAVLGLAELTKTTLILFYPLWPLMWFLFRWRDRCRMMARDWFREAGMLAVRMLIGLYVLNLGYAFEGSFKQLKEFRFVSGLFTGFNPSLDPKSESRNLKSGNRFADSWLGLMPVPFPKNYLHGIDLQQRDFEYYGRRSYLRGEWQDHGWWYYYLFASAIKIPFGLWMLAILVFISRAVCPAADLPRVLDRPPRAYRDEFILLFPAIVIFAIASAKYGFSEHFRYVLPSFPYFFIFISQLASTAASQDCLKTRGRNS